MYLCSPKYHTRGTFWFDDVVVANKKGPRVRAGETCLPAPQPPNWPPVPPPDVCPTPNAPAPDVPPMGCGPISPLMVDLSGDGIHMSNLENGVIFNILGPAGRPYWVAWPLGEDDEWVALDRNLSGTIDDAGELFGTATTLLSGQTAENGFQALAEHDENHDGVIDPSDAVFEQLLLWSDKNRNGFSEPSELKSLWESQVGVLKLNYVVSKAHDEWGNGFYLRSESVLTSRGAPVRPLIDVYPVVRQVQLLP